MSLIALLILILPVIAVAPAWPYSRRWGDTPSGLFGLPLAIVGGLALMGRL